MASEPRRIITVHLHAASFKDSRAASDSHARIRSCACTRRRSASAETVEHGAYVLRNFELGFNEANDTAVRLLIRVRDNPNVYCNRIRCKAV